MHMIIIAPEVMTLDTVVGVHDVIIQSNFGLNTLGFQIYRGSKFPFSH